MNINPINPGIPLQNLDELQVINHYLTESQCDNIIDMAQQYSEVKTSIGNIGENGVVQRTRSVGFIANRIDLPKGTSLYKAGQKICSDIFKKLVPEYYSAKIKSYESPHILRYTSGGTYGLHSDSHNFDPESQSWKKVVNRDYSSILYLNADFTGGELSFPKLNARITPQKGMLLIFPSHEKFIHTAEPTTSGERFAFVTWAAKRGAKGVPGAPRGEVIRLK